MCQGSKATPKVLAACFICGGVPAVMVLNENTRKPLHPGHKFLEPVWLDAFVFCTECGAQTGEQTAEISSYSELAELMAKAHDAWNTRDNRNQDLYAAAVTSGCITPPPGADGWIPVGVEMPHYDTPVDVVCMGRVQHIAHQLKNLGTGDFWMIGTDDDDYEGLTLEEVSHWRPRPVFIQAGGETQA